MSYEQMMAELRAEYLATLPERIRDIETHLKAKDFGGLYNDFHKLKGSGKTYGIPEITEVAEVFEKIGLALSEGQTPKLPLDPWIVKSVQMLNAILKSRLEQKAFELAQSPDFVEARRITGA